MRDGNSIVSIPRNGSTSKEDHEKRRGRSAGPSKMNKRGRRSMSEPPAYIQKAKQMPEMNVVIEKLSQQEVDDLVLKLKLKGIICREVDSLNGKHAKTSIHYKEKSPPFEQNNNHFQILQYVNSMLLLTLSLEKKNKHKWLHQLYGIHHQSWIICAPNLAI